MPTSAPGCRSRRKPVARGASGFTLIEIMIVVVIMSVAVAMIGINFGVLDRRNTSDELVRLQRVLQYASERAAVRGTPLQVEFLPGSYRFSTLDTSGKWQLLFEPPELAEHNWIAGLALQGLVVDEQVTTPGNHRLIFTAESLPFRLDIATPDGVRRIDGNSAGEVVLQDAPGTPAS